MSIDDLVIDVKGLNKHFGDKHVVCDTALQVKRGEIYGFLGPNGSGKTTTIRMICGLLTPDSGEGHCLGYDIIKQAHEIKLHVGYMTQKFSFYEDLSIYENLDFIARLYQIKNRKKRIKEIIEQFGFGERYKQLTGSLSGGWKQRVALAACLLHKPQLLLLDEPTAGVDPKARREFWDVIFELSAQGITTLVSTHYMDEAERCTRLAYIAYGNLLVHGTIQEVIDSVALTTWQARGPHLAKLAQQLKSNPIFDQVAIFGETLHVSAHNKKALESAIKSLKTAQNYEWSPIQSELEDAFIYLVSQVKDNFSG